MDKRQIRTIFLSKFKLGRRATETARDINDALSLGTTKKHTAQWWFEKFRTGDESLGDDERSGRPSAVDNEQLRARTVGTHIQEIRKSKKLDKWVPHELTQHQRDLRFELASALLLRNRNDPFLDRIVTCDEKWILCNNCDEQASGWTRIKPHNIFPSRSSMERRSWCWFGGLQPS
ncbi:hypothetical protein V3C99_016305 [Haemonchus contortus]